MYLDKNLHQQRSCPKLYDQNKRREPENATINPNRRTLERYSIQLAAMLSNLMLSLIRFTLIKSNLLTNYLFRLNADQQ